MKLVVRVFAWFMALPYLGIVILVTIGAPTWSGLFYVTAIGVMLLGLATLPDVNESAASRARDTRQIRRPRGLIRGGAGTIVVIALVRSCTAKEGTHLRLVEAGTKEGGARLVARLLDEGDVAIPATRVISAIGPFRDDARELPSAMRAAYQKMREEEGASPSPLVPTYLGLQSPPSFDVVMLEPAGRPRGAVVFLHGYAGNFALPCWQIARSVRELGVLTACPSTRWVGDWWSPAGEATLRRTLDMLRGRGIDRVVLAGLSNGGYGASRLAPKMPSGLSGLILISGADPSAGPPGVPVLLVHGRHDSTAGFGQAEAYAKKRQGKLVALDAGHFAMLVRAEEADRAIREFVDRCLPL